MSEGKSEPVDVGKILASGPWFAGLPPDIAAEVQLRGRLTSLGAGAALFEQDGPPSGLHAVITGSLRVFAVTSGGDLNLVGFPRPGDWVGFVSCLDRGPHVYSGVAQQEMLVFSLSPAAVAAIFERDVATFRYLLTPELNMARQIYTYMLEDVGEPHRRVAARLTGLGRRPYSVSGLPIRPLDGLKQDELAMSVKLSRQTVNATLRSFEAKGLIELGYGRIRVLDPVALENIAKFGARRGDE